FDHVDDGICLNVSATRKGGDQPDQKKREHSDQSLIDDRRQHESLVADLAVNVDQARDVSAHATARNEALKEDAYQVESEQAARPESKSASGEYQLPPICHQPRHRE